MHRLLEPIGQHRKTHVKPSKGKRKRKQVADCSDNGTTSTNSRNLPPAPEIIKFLTIGFNSTQRLLESAAMESASRSRPTESSEEKSLAGALAIVFVDRSKPGIMHNHLPLLVSAAASFTTPENNIRLVSLPTGAEIRLSTALGIPRAGSVIGLLNNAPGSEPLVDFLRKRVAVIETPWVRAIQRGD